jgi:AraC family transcriptional regulator
MKPKIIEEKEIILVGMDFYGNPYEKAGGWSEQNAIGELWKKFSSVSENKKSSIKHLVSDSGYEVWIDFEGEKDTENKYIFVGVEVAKLEDLPLEFVARIMPKTKYAVFTMKMPGIKAEGIKMLWNKWLPETGLKTSFNYMIEYYDNQRFKGMDNPDSEIDFMVPIQ